MPGRECAGCGRPGPIELEMTNKSGQVLTMLSCTRCEARSWLVDGQQIGRDDVLKLTSGDPDFVMVPSVQPRRASRAR